MVIDPPRPGKLPPNHNNHLPDYDQRRTTTTVRPPVTRKRIFPIIPKSTTTTTTTTIITTTTKAPLPPKRVTPSHPKPSVPTRKPFVPTKKSPKPTRRPYIPTRPVAPSRRPPLPPQVTPVDNTIQKEVTKQRGDVHSETFILFYFTYSSWYNNIIRKFNTCFRRGSSTHGRV